MRGESESRLVGRLVSFALREKPSIIPITLLGILSSIAEITAMVSIIPLGILASGGALSAHSLWRAFPAALGLEPNTKFFVVFFLALLLFRLVTNSASLVLSSYTMQMLFAHFASRAHAAFVHHLSFQEIVKHQIGHFFAIAGDESNRGAQIVVGLMRIIPVMFLFTAYTAFIFYQSWRGGIGLFLLIAAMLLALKGAFRKNFALGRRQQDESRATNTHFFDSLGGLRTVRGFTAESFVIKRYESLIMQYTWTSFLTEAFAQLTQAPVMVIIAVLMASIVFYVDNAVMVSNMPLFFAGVMMFTRLMPTASYGLEAAMRLTANLKAGRNIDEMLQAIQDAEKADVLAPFPAGERIVRITFNDLSFRYTHDTPEILRNFSCELKAGTSYAITGPSGTGKSSLVDLLLKFYAPEAGSIRVNGRDITQLSTASLRQHIILAEQATRIFYGTVLENVQFDDVEAKDKAEAALRLVGLTDLLKSLPNGLATMLTFQGSNFSGGQRQRIGIARAMVRTADVLILDESTNALDHDTRKSILDTLLASYKDRILIFVTHDPYVIERVDEVIALRPPGQRADGDTIAASQ
jgi:ABC-type multidrug transport system fused ATPase/permease subunit